MEWRSRSAVGVAASVVGALVLAACVPHSRPVPPQSTAPSSSAPSRAVVVSAPTPSPASTPLSTRSPSPRSPHAGSGSGTFTRIPPQGFTPTAYAGAVYSFYQRQGNRSSVTLTALAFDGHQRSAVIARGEITYYFMSLIAGPHGVYGSTAVTRRFTKIPNEVLRIDPATLRVTARRDLFPGGGHIVVAGLSTYLVTATTVERVDPVTLRTLASYTRTDPLNWPMGGISFIDVVMRDNVVYARYGDISSTVFRLDASTLRPLPGHWHMQGQGLSLVATTSAVWEVGDFGVRRLIATGGWGPTFAMPGGEVNAVAIGSGMVVTNNSSQPLLYVADNGATKPLPYNDHGCWRPITDGTYEWAQCGVRLALVRFVLADGRLAQPDFRGALAVGGGLEIGSVSQTGQASMLAGIAETSEWSGVIDGRAGVVYAGSKDYTAGRNAGAVGAVSIRFPTPTSKGRTTVAFTDAARPGPWRIIASHGPVLAMRDGRGVAFHFDALTRSFTG